jgi:signal peptidase I
MTPKTIPKLFLILPLAAVLILLATFLRPPGATVHLKAFRIPSGAMEPSLLVGDFVMVEMRPTFRPKRDDLVVFASVEEPDLAVISRVVATAGDTVGMSEGKLFLNEHQPPFTRTGSAGAARADSPTYLERMARWQEPYLLHPVGGYSPDRRNWGPLIVPPHAFLVLGDNRDASYDSRYWGFLPATHILGKPRYVYFSYDPRSLRPVPWLSAIRWVRIGQRFP